MLVWFMIGIWCLFETLILKGYRNLFGGFCSILAFKFRIQKNLVVILSSGSSRSCYGRAEIALTDDFHPPINAVE